MKRLLPLALLLATTAHAAPHDYRLDSSGWNGLSKLGDEAEAVGCKVAAADELDWSRLGPRDVVFMIYPQSPVEPVPMAEYLERGGKLLLADDFGSAEEAFATLELRRIPARLDGVPRQTGHPELPIAHARLLTVLGRSTEAIVANHPAAFATQLPATYTFSPGQALVVEGQVGKGRFVALADPSVLINNMMELEGNRLFVRALIAELCRPGADGDRVHVFTGVFEGHSAPRPSVPSNGGPLQRLNDALGGLNQSMDQVGDALTWPLSVVLCIAAAVVAWAGLARRRTDRHVDGGFTRAERSETTSPTSLVAAMLPTGDHGLALLLLRAEVMRRLGAALGPISVGGQRRALVQRVEERFGASLARHVDDFFDSGPAELTASRRPVSASTFASALEHARPVLARLPLSEDNQVRHASV
ncbi:MAG: DUF4350 domain-containing protein [Polyangia bacterium]